MHSFTDNNGKKWTACCECNRGGNGNDKDKCSCGWNCTSWNNLGCYLGEAIVGDIVPKKKASKPKQRYQRFLEYGDGFDNFMHFCRWDANPEHEWNGGRL